MHLENEIEREKERNRISNFSLIAKCDGAAILHSQRTGCQCQKGAAFQVKESVLASPEKYIYLGYAETE